MAIMFAVTKDLSFALGNMLVGLNEFNSKLYDAIIIYHDGISTEDQQALLKLDQRCEFRSLTRDEWIKKQFGSNSGSEALGRVNEAIDRYSHFMFVKLDVFELLHEFHHAIFLDVDMIVNGDLSPILENGPMAWRDGTKRLNQKFHPFTVRDTDFLGISDSDAIPNGGLIYVSDKLPFEKMLVDARDFISRYVGKIAWTIDETTFGWVAFKHKIPVKSLPYRYNTWYGHAEDETVVIHAIGSRKFWNDAVNGLAFPRWGANNVKWLAAGGRGYQGVVGRRFLVPDSSSMVLDVFNNTEIWRNAFENIRLSIPSELIPPSNFSKRYFQFNVRGLDKSLHYELRTTGDDKFTVAFHCEVLVFSQSDLWNSKLSAAADLLPNFNLVKSEGRLSLEALKVPLSDLSDTITVLYAATIKDIWQLSGIDK